MLISQGWLRTKADADPDIDCEAGPWIDEMAAFDASVARLQIAATYGDPVSALALKRLREAERSFAAECIDLWCGDAK